MWCEEVEKSETGNRDLQFGFLAPQERSFMWLIYARTVAQLVECAEVFREVAGSIPVGSAIYQDSSRCNSLSFLFWWFNLRVTPLPIPNREVKP
jgi:hypothetical protein